MIVKLNEQNYRAKKDKLKENRETQDIREWYLATYPTDEVGEDILKGKTFEELYRTLQRKGNFYRYIFGNSLGAGDSVVSERIFSKLSELKGITYEEIYDQWLLGESKKKVIKEYVRVGRDDKDEMTFTSNELKFNVGDIVKVTDFMKVHSTYERFFDENNILELKANWERGERPDHNSRGKIIYATNKITDTTQKYVVEIRGKNYIFSDEGLKLVRKANPRVKKEEFMEKELLNNLVEKELGEKPLKVVLEKVGSTDIVKATLKDNTSINYVLLGEDLFAL